MHPAPATPLRSRRASCRPGSALASLALLLAVGCGGGERRMQEVRTLQEEGRFDASIDQLEEVLAASPDLPEANYRLGLALVQIGEPSRAIWPLQKAAASSGYEISAGILLASTLFQTQNFDQAIRAADRVLAADPERAAAMRIRANAYLAARQPGAALPDTRRLVELRPDDYGARALHATVLSDLGRLEEAERAHDLLKKMGQESGDPAFASRACLAPAIFADRVLGEAERAKHLYDDCAEQEPSDPVVIGHLVAYFDRAGESARGTALWQTAVETHPDDLELRRGLASRLRSLGMVEEAEATLREAAERLDDAAAWGLLASFYRAGDDPEKALGAIEKVIASAPEDERARFIQADVLVDVGELERAEQVAAAIDQPVYQKLLRGRIHLMRGEPALALAEFEEGIRAWPGHAAARFLAGIAARDLGDLDRAVGELRESIRADNAETDAALELARIQLLRGHHREAVRSASLALRGRRGLQQPEPYVIAARALATLGHPERARRWLDNLEERSYAREALAERMRLERSLAEPGRAIALAEESGRDPADPAERTVLEQWVLAEIDAGAADSALARTESALARSPGSAPLLVLRGAVHAAAGRPEEARASFESAVAADPENADAHAGLASLAADAGDRRAAIASFDRADALAPGDGRHAYASAQLALAGGDRDAAVARLREITKRHPGRLEARNDLAWLLAERGEQLDLALELARDASRSGDSAQALDTLGWVHFRRGEYEEAVEALERAIATAPDAASSRYRLALALERAGDPERAAAMLERALAGGPFPEAEDARRRLAEASR